MVDETVQNGSVYWVSAGAEYNGANEVWVGQASFATITDALVIFKCTILIYTRTANCGVVFNARR